MLMMSSCVGSVSSNESAISSAQDSSRREDNANFKSPDAEPRSDEDENKPVLEFKDLYPILRKSLLKNVCESYRIAESENSLEAYSLESDMFLSKWEWDFVNKPLLTQDIDNDGLLDYTLELFNSGGGCGGQFGTNERWTLFGSKPGSFVLTHIIPYRSSTGSWEKVNSQ
jgi:hypothetical protein